MMRYLRKQLGVTFRKWRFDLIEVQVPTLVRQEMITEPFHTPPMLWPVTGFRHDIDVQKQIPFFVVVRKFIEHGGDS